MEETSTTRDALDRTRSRDRIAHFERSWTRRRRRGSSSLSTTMASTKIKTIARLRPHLNGEIDDGVVTVHRDEDGSNAFVSIAQPREQQQRIKFQYVFKFRCDSYTALTLKCSFSSCYGQDSSQTEIYERDVKPLIDNVYSGMVRSTLDGSVNRLIHPLRPSLSSHMA